MIDFINQAGQAAVQLAASMLLLGNRDKANETAIAFARNHKEAAVAILTAEGYLLNQMQEVHVNRDPRDFLTLLSPITDLKIPHPEQAKTLFVTREEAINACWNLYEVRI
ncbi:hypothetical protein E4T63_12830 [Pseudomonas fluorescens]|uniref:Uncharacterized protein n=1 Tax=Pseudomonas fluorescens TaxID=294 RepID=A0AAP8Z0P6_PSEFL|nr:hypothetical protein [Pseudomonas fluorescens]QBX41422.1 hypothetical protein E4T63_12830 [Pseudomonas fluorescens]